MRTVSVPKTEGLPPDLERRARGAYLGLAVGDALGATVEFMTPNEIRLRHGVHDQLLGGGWLRLRRGQVTDDTEMSLALGDCILRQQGRVDAHGVALAFSDWMREKPVDIGHTVRRGIVHYRHTGEPRVPYDDQGAGNGAAMRCLPVALATLASPADVVRRGALDQARTTHHNALSDVATVVLVELVQAALRGASRDELCGAVDRFVTANPEFGFRARRPVQNPSGYIVDTLRAVFQAFATQSSFETALVDVVNRGGDADTTGAILGMLAGALYGVDSIPLRWLQRLDPGVAQRVSRQSVALLRSTPMVRDGGAASG